MRSFRAALALRTAGAVLALTLLLGAISALALRALLYRQLDGTLASAVVLDAKPGGSQVEVVIAAQGYAARLLCDIISSAQAGEETVIHLRFRDLTPPQLAFIRQLVGWLVEVEAQAS